MIVVSSLYVLNHAPSSVKNRLAANLAACAVYIIVLWEWRNRPTNDDLPDLIDKNIDSELWWYYSTGTAAKPDLPTNLSSKVWNLKVDDISDSLSAHAVASITWVSPKNNDTNVVSYNVTLLKNSTKITSVSLRNPSYTPLLTQGSYEVIVTAIDLCGQESEPATKVFEVPNNSSGTAVSIDQQHNAMQVGITVTIVLGLLIVMLSRD